MKQRKQAGANTNNDRDTPAKGSNSIRPCSIGEISGVIGCDIRELIIDGWTWKRINQLVDEKMPRQVSEDGSEHLES